MTAAITASKVIRPAPPVIRHSALRLNSQPAVKIAAIRYCGSAHSHHLPAAAGRPISARCKTSAEPYPACTIACIVCRAGTGAVPPVPAGVAARPGAPAAVFMIVLCAGSVVREAFS